MVKKKNWKFPGRPWEIPGKTRDNPGKTPGKPRKNSAKIPWNPMNQPKGQFFENNCIDFTMLLFSPDGKNISKHYVLGHFYLSKQSVKPSFIFKPGIINFFSKCTPPI